MLVGLELANGADRFLAHAAVDLADSVARFCQSLLNGADHLLGLSAGGLPTRWTGIGLALSCSIIQAHGGNLWFDDTEQGGATFRFTLRPAPHPEPSGSEDSLEEGLYPSSTGERAARGASA